MCAWIWPTAHGRRTPGPGWTCSIVFLLAYLVLLLYGGFSSTHYALEYGERSYSSWRPYMAPIKIVACIGILLMLLQAFAVFFRDMAKLRGVEL